MYICMNRFCHHSPAFCSRIPNFRSNFKGCQIEFFFFAENCSHSLFRADECLRITCRGFNSFSSKQLRKIDNFIVCNDELVCRCIKGFVQWPKLKLISAWNCGHDVRLKKRRSWVRIPPGCKVKGLCALQCCVET
jgi:hypothetical protein